MKSKDPFIAKDAFENVAEDLNQCMLWLDENLPKEYTNPEDLARAYENLSRADVFNGRITRWQHWRFLTYVRALMTAGVAVSKDEKNKEFIAYKPTGRILKMWWAKQKNMKKKAIAEKIADKTHSSKKEIIKNIDYYKVIFQNNNEMADSIAKELDLNKEEIDYLKK
jgi:replication factor C large subunit